MNKTKSLLALLSLAAVTLSTGCANHSKLATINGIEVHRITARSAFAPNVTVIVTADPANPGHIDFPVQAAGPSIANSVISAAGGVGAATMLGNSIRPNKNIVNNTAQGGGGGYGEGGQAGDSFAQGGSSYATGGAGGAGGQGGGGGQGYGGYTSSSANTSSTSSSYSQSDSWSGVIGSGNVNNRVNVSPKHRH